jgi:chromosomal replication initiator protein
LKILDRSLEAALAAAISRRIGAPRYSLWFAQHTRYHSNGDELVVGVPNRHFEEWLQKTFGEAVVAAAREIFGRPTEVRFQIDPALFQAARREQAQARQASAAPPAASPATAPHSKVDDTQSGPSSRPPARSLARRRWRRLSEFVVGACNRVAHASVVSILESPREGPNPLLLHGPVGTGKTHLLEGLYAGLRRARPEWRVMYLTAEEFTNRFVQAMRLGKLGAFRKQFRSCDALLLDDLHFLASKRATQEEFLHTFDALQSEGRQIVLTCDCHPRLADDLGPELTDRLLGGAVWSLAPPDAATRLAILRSKALAEKATIPDDVLKFLAERLHGNVRELEGALHSVRHYARVAAKPIDVALVREALADLLRHAVRLVQLADVERCVSSVFKLDGNALQSRVRTWAVSHPRMIAMFLARRHTAASYSEVCAHFGGRNHSTAVAAEKKVRQWLQSDAELSFGNLRVRVRDLIERIEQELLR